jgi:hypothetical protein
VCATASQKNRQAERCQRYHGPSFHNNSPYLWFIAASCLIVPSRKIIQQAKRFAIAIPE